MTKHLTSESLVACIGTGLSAIALGAQLQRWYGLTDVVFFDKYEQLGGTWWTNTYPGCACDVPSALYSFSFETNPNWSCLYPPADEIRLYAQGVADKYRLPSNMRFNSMVERCVWDEERNVWVLRILDLKSKQRYEHACTVLFSCTGFLDTPKRLDIPEVDNFCGHILHSARWKKNVELSGKHVAVLGNGCSATQIIPAIIQETSPIKVTQIIRTKQWMFPPLEMKSSPLLQWILKKVPGAIHVHRFYIFLLMERIFWFTHESRVAVFLRRLAKRDIAAYMREKSPRKYHDQLVPEYELGCKRGVINRGYLESLYDPRVHLESRPLRRVLSHGLEFEDGDTIHADVEGVDGKSLDDHWAKFGGPEAYNCISMNGFPNFFMILGPNAASSHTAALMAAENSINYTLRLLRPIFQRQACRAEVKWQAEVNYSNRVQRALRNRVWSGGCSSWYVKQNGWNGMLYPWTQAHFWFRSLFPNRADWTIA